MQAVLNGLIEKMWTENVIQDTRLHELVQERRQCIVGIIQAIGQPNTQFGSNAERANSEQKYSKIRYTDGKGWIVYNFIPINKMRTNVQTIYHWKDN